MHHLASVIKTVEVGGHTLIHPYTLAFSSVRVGFDYAVHCLKSGLTNNSQSECFPTPLVTGLLG